MRSVKLCAIEDRSSGTVGLILGGMRRFDFTTAANDGRLIAHDLLEHQQGARAIGSIDDELIALGGAWYIRGQFSDLSRDGFGSRYSAEESVGSDIANMAELYLHGVRFHSPVPRTKACIHDDAFREIVEYGKHGFIREESCGDEAIDWSLMDDYFSACLHYLRRGFRMASRRFQNAHAANRQFWAITEAVDRYAKHAEHEGQEYRLRYGNGYAACEEIYPDEYY